MNEMLMSTMTTMTNNVTSNLNTAVSTADLASSTASFGSIFGIFAGLSFAFILGFAVLYVLIVIANWRIFTKAGEEGWKSIIPIYNTIILFKISGINPLWVLGYFAAIIPIVGTLFVAGLTIYLMMKLAQAFGKGIGFTLGLIFLDPIFMLILGLGDSEYQLDKAE